MASINTALKVVEQGLRAFGTTLGRTGKSLYATSRYAARPQTGMNLVSRMSNALKEAPDIVKAWWKAGDGKAVQVGGKWLGVDGKVYGSTKLAKDAGVQLVKGLGPAKRNLLRGTGLTLAGVGLGRASKSGGYSEQEAMAAAQLYAQQMMMSSQQYPQYYPPQNAPQPNYGPQGGDGYFMG